MNRIKHILFATAVAAAVALGGITATSYAAASDSDHTAIRKTAMKHDSEAAKSDHEAASLEAMAEQHANMAALYRIRISGGSKQEAVFRSLANHCDRLAASYRQAASEAHARAASPRAMAAGA